MRWSLDDHALVYVPRVPSFELSDELDYEDRKSNWNSGVRKEIRQESAEEEVRKYQDLVTGAWKQISKQRRRVNVRLHAETGCRKVYTGEVSE